MNWQANIIIISSAVNSIHESGSVFVREAERGERRRLPEGQPDAHEAAARHRRLRRAAGDEPDEPFLKNKLKPMA